MSHATRSFQVRIPIIPVIPVIPVSNSGDFDRASRAGYFLLLFLTRLIGLRIDSPLSSTRCQLLRNPSYLLGWVYRAWRKPLQRAGKPVWSADLNTDLAG